MKIEADNQTLALLQCAVYGFKIQHDWETGYSIVVPNIMPKDAPIVLELNQKLNDYTVRVLSEKEFKKELTWGKGRLSKDNILIGLGYARGCCGYCIGEIKINNKIYK